MAKEKTKSMFGLFIKALEQEMEAKIEEKFLKLKEELIQENEITNEYLTAKDVCKIFKISSTTLERYVRSGLKYSSSGKGCKRLFNKTDVKNFINQRNGR